MSKWFWVVCVRHNRRLGANSWQLLQLPAAKPLLVQLTPSQRLEAVVEKSFLAGSLSPGGSHGALYHIGQAKDVGVLLLAGAVVRSHGHGLS